MESYDYWMESHDYYMESYDYYMESNGCCMWSYDLHRVT